MTHDLIRSMDYIRGRLDGLKGVRAGCAPHEPGTIEYRDWFDGYRSGLASRLIEVQRREVARVRGE